MTSNLFVTAAGRTRSGLLTDPLRAEVAVYEAAGFERPRTVLDILERLDAEATPEQVIQDMTQDAESLGDDWLEDALTRYARAACIQEMRGKLSLSGRRHATEARRADPAGTFDLVSGSITDALARLRVPSKALPHGAAALRPEANIDAHTTDELAEARQTLTRLGTMVGLLPAPASKLINGDLLLILDVPRRGTRTRPRTGQ